MKKKILFIMMLFMALTGSYICTTNAAKGPIQTMPKFSSVPPANTTASVGQNIEIEAKANGTPAPEIRWYKYDRRIVESDKYSIQYKDGRSTLTIKNANIKDSGVYEVVAENDLGKINAKCEILVL